jgi:hypothetical protein
MASLAMKACDDVTVPQSGVPQCTTKCRRILAVDVMGSSNCNLSDQQPYYQQHQHKGYYFWHRTDSDASSSANRLLLLV